MWDDAERMAVPHDERYSRREEKKRTVVSRVCFTFYIS
jgi:hypothetical protein